MLDLYRILFLHRYICLADWWIFNFSFFLLLFKLHSISFRNPFISHTNLYIYFNARVWALLMPQYYWYHQYILNNYLITSGSLLLLIAYLSKFPLGCELKSGSSSNSRAILWLREWKPYMKKSANVGRVSKILNLFIFAIFLFEKYFFQHFLYSIGTLQYFLVLVFKWIFISMLFGHCRKSSILIVHINTVRILKLSDVLERKSTFDNGHLYFYEKNAKKFSQNLLKLMDDCLLKFS